MALNAVVVPPEDMLQAAVASLEVAPLSGYSGFTLPEVRVLAAYRCQFAFGIGDPIWMAIVDGTPEAWMYAIHEAAEIEAFAGARISFVDPEAWKTYFQEAHTIACIHEARFLKAWADHLGYNTSEMALEIRNPIRRQYRSHAQEAATIQQSTGWNYPSADEVDQAQAFYRRILG